MIDDGDFIEAGVLIDQRDYDLDLVGVRDSSGTLQTSFSCRWRLDFTLKDLWHIVHSNGLDPV